MNRLSILAAVALAAAITAEAGAGTLGVDANGTVVDWGVTPFSQANGVVASGPTFHAIANDYAPINYPGGVGRVPSPDGQTGEKFDLEELHGRLTEDGMLEVLLVTSSPWTADAAGSTWRLGDLFVTVDDQTFAVVTQSAGRGYAAGDVFAVAGEGDVALLEDKPQGYLHKDALVENDYGPDAPVRDVAGPWQLVDGLPSGQKLGAAALAWASHDYAGEAGTFLLEYTIDLGTIGAPATFDLGVHVAWGCGNDVIEAGTTLLTPIPEPATAMLLGIGGIAMTRRAGGARRRPAAR